MSEIDIFDWSPTTSDNNLMSIDDYCWTADTLFSTINSTPFPFPDPREIGKNINFDFELLCKIMQRVTFCRKLIN